MKSLLIVLSFFVTAASADGLSGNWTTRPSTIMCLNGNPIADAGFAWMSAYQLSIHGKNLDLKVSLSGESVSIPYLLKDLGTKNNLMLEAISSNGYDESFQLMRNGENLVVFMTDTTSKVCGGGNIVFQLRKQ